mmetsp:Transcript_9183/g.16532  ORF Transcript_9183/g.16532 Transcript_9183/m.16532 type:complete len:367 (-) Transcript_9183:211-1311(-)
MDCSGHITGMGDCFVGSGLYLGGWKFDQICARNRGICLKRVLFNDGRRCGVSVKGLCCMKVDKVSGNVIDSVGVTDVDVQSERKKELNKIQWDNEDSVVNGLKSMAESGLLRKYAESKPLARRVSVMEMRMLTRQKVTPKTLDFSGDKDATLISNSFYSTFFASVILSLFAQEYLPGPDYFRYTVVFLIASAPFGFLIAGLSLPQLLQYLLIYVQRLVSIDFRERLARHEAGHMLVGYLLGLPLKEYRADSVTNAVQFYFEPGAFSVLDHEKLDILASVSLAGAVAEALKFGDARGGFADLMQLQSFMARASPALSSDEIQNKVRWGSVRAYTLLQQNQNAMEELVKLLARNAPIPECIQAIEEFD